MNKLINLIAVMLLLPLLSLTGVLVSQDSFAAERKVIKLRVVAGHPYAKGTFWVRNLEDFFCREVEKRVLAQTKNYKIECKGYYGGSVAKLGEVLETVQNGLGDIGLITTVFEMAKIEPINFTFWIPFNTNDIDKNLRAFIKTFRHFALFKKMFAKYKQIPLGEAFWPHTSYQLITKFPVKTLEDLKGKKLGHGGPMLPWLAALGATSVQANYNEVYTSMDTGVIDGYAMPSNVATAFKIYEVGPYFTIVDFASTVCGVVTMNMNKWNKMPPVVQKILAEVGTEYTWKLRDEAEQFQKKSIALMKSKGVTVYTLPEAERTRWAKILTSANVTKEAVERCKSRGYPADEIVKFYIKTLQEDEGYKFPYPPNL